MKTVKVKTLEQLGRAMRNLQIVANPRHLKMLTMCNKITRSRIAGLNTKAYITSTSATQYFNHSLS